MHSLTYVRLNALTLSAGAALCAIGQAIHPASPVDPIDGPLHAAYFISLLLILIGLLTTATWLSARSGPLGLLGALGIWLALALMEVPHAVLSATVLPALLADPSTAPLIDDQSVVYSNLMHGVFPVLMAAGSGLMVLGTFALSIATLRSPTLPRWPAVLLVVGVLANFAPGHSNIGPMLFYAGLAGYGMAEAFGWGRETWRRLGALRIAIEA